MNKKNKERGFTMLEVIAILIILGIIVAVAVSRYMSRQAYESIPETEIFKSHLRYAEQLSINGDGTNGDGTMDTTWAWGIQIGAGTTSYSLVRLHNNVVTGNGTLPGENDHLNSNTHTFISGVTLTGVIANDKISFNQWGSPSVNNIPLVNNLAINVIEGSVTNTFTITKNTGFIQ
jgi:type II secretory pathway pseudopilin PulG